jgi:TolA-binding protein
MKRIFLPLVILLAPFAAPALRAQDAAVEERLNKLTAQIQDSQDLNAKLQKQIDNLAREVQELREQQNHPAGNYAAQDDLKRLAEKVQEIDQKREADKQLILNKIAELGKIISAPARPSKNSTGTPPKENLSTPDKAGASDQNRIEYVIQENDNLGKIVKAYREKNIKVTVDQILKANPGLDEYHMSVGKKIWIPVPQQ